MNKLASQPVVRTSERKIKASPHRYGRILRDFALLNLALYLSARLSYGELTAFDLEWRHLRLIVFINVAWALLAMRFEAYGWYEQNRVEQELAKVGEVFLFHLTLVTLYRYHFQHEIPNPVFFFVFYASALLLISSVRIFYRIARKNPTGKFRYVVVGGEQENLRTLTTAFNFSFHGAAELVGRFGNTQLPNVMNIGSYEELLPYLRHGPAIDKLVFFYSRLSHEQECELFRICNNQFIDVEVAPRATSIFPRGYECQQLGEMIMLTTKCEPLMRLRNKILKRLFDIVFSLGVLLFIFPIMFVIIATLIKLEGKGPVFFRQERSGYRNSIFKMIKFRTMQVNDESDVTQATVSDSRVTRIGAFLRRTSLDEFPQFINVFLGDMSVVGPRPHMLYHTHQYAKIIKPYMIRHKIKPGVTGWAQINGFRGPTDELWKMEKRVQHDVWYLENWSILLDLRCIISTVTNAVRGEDTAL